MIMQDLKVKQYSIPFKAVAISENTNSFGLYQLILVSKSGEAYKSHASIYNIPKQGDFVNLLVTTKEGRIVSSYFRGHELTTKLPNAPKDVVKEIFSK